MGYVGHVTDQSWYEALVELIKKLKEPDMKKNKHKIELVEFRGQWHYRLVSHNNKILNHSEKYHSKSNAKRAATAYFKMFKDGIVEKAY